MGTVVIDPAYGRRGRNLVGEALSESAMRRAVAGACVVLSLAGCAHGATRARRAHAELSTTSPVGVDDREADWLAALARGDGVARAVRLERLLDLFDPARVQPIPAPKISGVGPKAIAAMTSCLQDEGYSLRLREHRDTIAIVLRAT